MLRVVYWEPEPRRVQGPWDGTAEADCSPRRPITAEDNEGEASKTSAIAR